MRRETHGASARCSPGVVARMVHLHESMHARSKLVVLTGGPGAGKTATLEVVRRDSCKHVEVLSEAASIAFGGGFPRHATDAGRRAAQRVIFHVQRELERLTTEEGVAELILCDRGTLDGLAYWPGAEADFFRDTGTSVDAELARYAMVVHLRTPSAHHGYNHRNPLRIESAREAAAIDERIAQIWSRHPRRVTIECRSNFFEKLGSVVEILKKEMPADCLSCREIAERNELAARNIDGGVRP